MAVCCCSRVLCWQTRIAGLSNVQGHICFALFWFPIFLPHFYFFRILLFFLPPFSHVFAFSCFSSFFPSSFNPNTVPPSPQARVGLLLEIGCSLPLQRAMLKLQPGPARSVPSIIFLTTALLSNSECPYGVDGPFSEKSGLSSECYNNGDTGDGYHTACFNEPI